MKSELINTSRAWDKENVADDDGISVYRMFFKIKITSNGLFLHHASVLKCYLHFFKNSCGSRDVTLDREVKANGIKYTFS